MSKEQKLQLDDLDLLILDDPIKACLQDDNAIGACEYAIQEYYQYDSVIVLKPSNSLNTVLNILIITTDNRCISEKSTYISKKDMFGVYSYYLHLLGKL